MGDFNVVVEHLDGTVLVRPRGELDLATAPELERALHGVIGEHWAVVVDLSAVSFADCAGLRPVWWALQQPYLVSLHAAAAQPQVEVVLKLTGLSRSAAHPPDGGAPDRLSSC